MSIWMIIACRQQSPVVEAPVPAATDPVVEEADPAPYIVDGSGTDDAPLLSPEQVTAGVESSIDALFAVKPDDIADAYEQIWALRDDTCPYYYPEYLDLYNLYIWSDSCTSAAGATFDGYAYYMGWKDQVNSYYTYDRYFSLYGSPVSLRTPAGETLTGSGSAYAYDVDYWGYGYRSSSVTIQGAWRWEGPSYADSWLSRGLSLDIVMYTTQYGGTGAGATYTQVNGSLSDIDDEITAVNFVDVYAMNAATGSSCDSEPGGTIRLRDTAGGWYEVTFDGPAYAGAPSFPANCDGCGDIWWRGEKIGQACPDTSRLISWENRPWD